VLADADVDASVGSGFALVHDVSSGEDAVELEEVIVADRFQLGLLFDVAESGEVVGDFAFGARGGSGNLLTFFQGANVLQGKGVSLDGGGGVDVPGAAVLLESGNPGQIDAGSLNLFAEGGDGLHLVEESGADLELRLVAHG